jgi:hypothetical protein
MNLTNREAYLIEVFRELSNIQQRKILLEVIKTSMGENLEKENKQKR